MAVDMFLKLDGIKGESKDSKMKEEIDVLAWSWGVSNSGTHHMGGGGGAGKCNVQDLSLTKYVDKSSADLLNASATGKHIASAVLIVRKAGGEQQDYITITMSDVLVTSVSTGGSGGEDRLTENATLNFAKVKLEYSTQDEKGIVKNAGTFNYDIEGNTAA